MVAVRSDRVIRKIVYCPTWTSPECTTEIFWRIFSKPSYALWSIKARREWIFAFVFIAVSVISVIFSRLKMTTYTKLKGFRMNLLNISLLSVWNSTAIHPSMNKCLFPTSFQVKKYTGFSSSSQNYRRATVSFPFEFVLKLSKTLLTLSSNHKKMFR